MTVSPENKTILLPRRKTRESRGLHTRQHISGRGLKVLHSCGPCLGLLVGMMAFLHSTSCDAQDKVKAAAPVQVKKPIQIARGRVAIPLEQKLRELAQREIFFIKKVCQPNDEQLAKVIAEATGKVTDMQKMYLELSKEGNPAKWPKPQMLITDHLKKVVHDTFPPDVSDAYTRELDARRQANLTATASIVTNLIDSQVLLSHDEIEQLETDVSALETTRNATLPVAFFYRHMIPIPSVENMESLLTDRQLALWKTQKHPNYNQPWVNYFNSNDFLSSINPPGLDKKQVNDEPENQQFELRNR